MTNKKERVICYIDGYNLYFGINHYRATKPWRKYLWLDLFAFGQSILKSSQVLEEVKYFTTRIKNDPAKTKRQATYLDAIKNAGNVLIYEGYFSKGRYYCYNCKSSELCLKCGLRQKKITEKQSDVNLATELIFDACNNRFDVAILVGGDTDFVHPVRRVVAMGKKVHVLFPPDRMSGDICKVASSYGTIFTRSLRNHQYPEKIKLASRIVITKPGEWR